MATLTARPFHPEVLRLFDRFVHGLLSRSEFITGAEPFAGTGRSGEALLAALRPDFSALQVSPQDPRVHARHVDLPSPAGHGRIGGYLVERTDARGPLPAVLVVHENRGLNPHIEDIARRVALENYIAFAPDALTTLGGYPGDEDRARELFATLDRAKVNLDFLAAAEYLRSLPQVNGRCGAVGFCFGGGTVNFLATRLPELLAAVSFYGNAAPLADVGRIKAALQLHFAEHDERVNAQWPAFQSALQAAGVPFEVYRYPGTQHAFHNDTTPRYDAAAAARAWERTMRCFEAHLRG